MLTEALSALAAAGGTAVVQAAGTDVWSAVRERVVRMFSHSNARPPQRVIEQLDQTAAALEPVATEAEGEEARARLATAWQTRFEDLLEDVSEDERTQVAAQVRELLNFTSQQGVSTASAGDAGIAIGGDVHVNAREGSVGAGVIRGDVTLGNPTPPGPDQG